MNVLVVTPTYNEKENLPLLVEGVLKLDGVRLLVVDDGSPDGTGAIADRLAAEHPGRIEVMHRAGPRGLGRSYVDGLLHAIREGTADYICQMDCDLSHDPRHLPSLIVGTERADVVIGSRYIPGGAVVNWPLRRRLLSRFANGYIRAVTRLAARDCTSGYRCWRRDAIAALPLAHFESDGYSFLVEMLYAASVRGYRVAELPITFVERRQGVSKLTGGVLLESAATPWRIVATRSRFTA
jgi:dolichol-phosphate mannosyltransferase